MSVMVKSHYSTSERRFILLLYEFNIWMIRRCYWAKSTWYDLIFTVGMSKLHPHGARTTCSVLRPPLSAHTNVFHFHRPIRCISALLLSVIFPVKTRYRILSSFYCARYNAAVKPSAELFFFYFKPAMGAKLPILAKK